MRSERGLALITAIMVLGLLTIIGAALLASTNLDTQISVNYRTNTQLLYLAEAGLEEAREQLRVEVENEIDTNAAVSTVIEALGARLANYCGADCSTSVDPATLLGGSPPDTAFIATTTYALEGAPSATYTVFLRNDATDQVTSIIDSNEVARLVSVAAIGNSRTVVEMDVLKGQFPPIPAALTLNGDVPNNGFGGGTSNGFLIDGADQAGSGTDLAGVGVLDAGDEAEVTDAIDGPPAAQDYTDQYCGGTAVVDGTEAGADRCSGGPDIDQIGGSLESNLTTAEGLESLLDAVENMATLTGCPSGGWGTEADPPITFVDTYDPGYAGVSGECTYNAGPGGSTGWGMLVVEGKLTTIGSITWNGMVIVIDRTDCVASPSGHYNVTMSGNTQINGGLFVTSIATTPPPDHVGEACYEVEGAGTGGVTYNSDYITNAFANAPFYPISWVEYSGQTE